MELKLKPQMTQISQMKPDSDSSLLSAAICVICG
jgi:hypothetical protein